MFTTTTDYTSAWSLNRGVAWIPENYDELFGRQKPLLNLPVKVTAHIRRNRHCTFQDTIEILIIKYFEVEDVFRIDIYVDAIDCFKFTGDFLAFSPLSDWNENILGLAYLTWKYKTC